MREYQRILKSGDWKYIDKDSSWMHNFFKISKLKSSLRVPQRPRILRLKKPSRLKYDKFPHKWSSSISGNWHKISSIVFRSIVVETFRWKDFNEHKFLIDKYVSLDLIAPNWSCLSEESPFMLISLRSIWYWPPNISIVIL